MALEIRPAQAEEMEEFVRLVSGAMVQVPETFKDMQPEWTMCAFLDGKMVSTYGIWPFTMRFNGNGVPVAGVTMVSTSPVFRRQGYLRQIIRRHFERMYEERHQPVAILHANWVATYQRFGYGVVSTRNSYSIDPRNILMASEQPVEGTLREATDEMELFVDLYRRFSERRTGYLHRGRAMWEAGVLAPPHDGELVVYRVVYEEEGEPLGYLIYSLKPGEGGITTQLLNIRDIVWLSAPAYRAMWKHLAMMDLVASIRWNWVPPDDPLPHLLLEPRQLHMTSRDGLMGRIVDVEQALTRRQYPKEGKIVFEVADELCPWNNGKWKLEASGAEATVGRTDEPAQLTMPVSTLAMLAFGQISATEAARMQRLDVNDENALPLCDRIMRTEYRPFCADMF